MGRLANGMFSIAGTIGIAIKSGQNYAFPKWINHDAKERFGSTEDIDLYKYFINPLPEVPEGLTWNEYPYWWGYRDIKLPQGNWNLGGHMQSDKYFSHCLDVIRFYFTMANEVDVDGTAIHMRFGDYDGSYHPLPDPDYYYKALEHVSGPYYLYSDNLDEAKKICVKIGCNALPVTMNYLDSFRMMKRSKNFICGNSSYSLMAAILGDHPEKIVVVPRKWFGDHVSLETIDLFPEGSIVI
jgi:hypothetical protein